MAIKTSGGISPKGFEEGMLDSLKESNIVDDLMIGNVLDDITVEAVIKLLETPMKVELKEDGLVFKDEKRDYIECPNYGENISADSKWLSSKIPSVNFDIDQNGNLRKSEEAQSAYCCVIVVNVLKEEIFKNELLKVVRNYDYEEMVPNKRQTSFHELLENWQDLQSITINIAVSAAKYNIVSLKKDTERFLKDTIPEDLVAELRHFSDLITDVNRKYSTGILSPVNVKKLTKIEILTYIEKRKDKIKELKKESILDTKSWRSCLLRLMKN